MSEEEKKPEAEAEEEKEEEPEAEEDLIDTAVSEAEKIVVEEQDEIVEEAEKLSSLKSDVAKEFLSFIDECNEIEFVVKKFVPEDEIPEFLSENFDIKKAMKLVMKMSGHNEEVIEGEPSEYVKVLIQKIRQKLIDCRWLRAMLKGEKVTTPSQIKYEVMPDELLKAEGKKI